MQENFLNSIDPVVITRLGEKGPIKVHLHSEGELKDVTPVLKSEAELLEDVQLIRVRGNLHVETGQNEMDLQNAFRHLIEKVYTILFFSIYHLHFFSYIIMTYFCFRI